MPAPRVGVPRWPAAVTLVAVGGIYASLSGSLRVGPRGLLLVLVVVLLALLAGAHMHGTHRLVRTLALGAVGLVTVAIVASSVLLVSTLPGRGTPAPKLLRDAALLWITNVLTFAVWYWEIDAGGPGRRRTDAHESKDFLFPQVAADTAASPGWAPGFVDYLFLAFNTSTAFSPTDTAVLSQRAKLLMMSQSLISLLVIAVLAARAINTL